MLKVVLVDFVYFENDNGRAKAHRHERKHGIEKNVEPKPNVEHERLVVGVFDGKARSDLEVRRLVGFVVVRLE